MVSFCEFSDGCFMPIESKKNRPINFLFCALYSPLTSVFDENAKPFGFQGVVPLRNNQISLSKGFAKTELLIVN